MNKILVIKHGSLGDIIFALPAMTSIRKKFPKTSIELLTEKKYLPFLIKSKLFDNIIIDNRNNFLLRSFFIIFKLLKINYDLIIDLQNSQRTSFYNLFFRLFHSAKISSSRPFAHYRYYIPSQGSETVIEGLFNQLSLINIPKIDKQNYHWLEVNLKEKISKPLALFVTGVSKKGNHKQWQPEKFAEIAKYYENLNFTICVVGTPQDKASILPILNSCKNIINKVGQSPPEIIYTIALKSSIILSNDTGPGHIAALAKKNIILIANDNKISKSNLPAGSHVYKILSSSVKDITTEAVIDYIKKNNLD